jgi:hypothetical protein
LAWLILLIDFLKTIFISMSYEGTSTRKYVRPECGNENGIAQKRPNAAWSFCSATMSRDSTGGVRYRDSSWTAL